MKYLLTREIHRGVMTILLKNNFWIDNMEEAPLILTVGPGRR